MKRFISISIVVILIVTLFCGCHYSVKKIDEESTDSDTSMFIIIEQSGFWKVCYQKDTKVMYIMSSGSRNTGNFTIMLNPDGTPQIWNG